MKKVQEDKSAISHAGKPKKITLYFKNGSTIQFTREKKISEALWGEVNAVLVEQWLTKEELFRLYEIKI